jgi:hypothetical protein
VPLSLLRCETLVRISSPIKVKIIIWPPWRKPVMQFSCSSAPSPAALTTSLRYCTSARVWTCSKDELRQPQPQCGSKEGTSLPKAPPSTSSQSTEDPFLAGGDARAISARILCSRRSSSVKMRRASSSLSFAISWSLATSCFSSAAMRFSMSLLRFSMFSLYRS